jgi:low temperature requirement protein LtrA
LGSAHSRRRRGTLAGALQGARLRVSVLRAEREQTLAHVGDPLGTIPAVALCGGVALYLLGHNAFRLREEGSVSVPRLVVTILCCVLILVAVSVPSIITLAVLAVVLCGLAAFETVTSREFRRELRAR